MKPIDLFIKIEEITHSNFSHVTPKTLTELNENAECKEVKIEYSGKILTYKFDLPSTGSSNLMPFFKPGTANAMCDYIIFCLRHDGIHVFMCNLKSRSLGNTIRQVQAGFAFASFIIQTASRCINQEYNRIPEFVNFKAIHFTTKIFRGTTNPSKQLLSKYDNNLKYIHRHCNSICSLDKIMLMD